MPRHFCTPLCPCDAVMSLLPFERYSLHSVWTLLLENGAGHVALSVELELEGREPALVLAHVAAEQRDGQALMPAAVRYDLGEDALRAAGGGHLAGGHLTLQVLRWRRPR